MNQSKSFLSWKTLFGFSAVISLAVPTVANAAQNHYYSGGKSLYSIKYSSVDNDNGICYQGAKNWTTAAGTTMTQDSSASNKCYYRDLPETWYGLYTPYNTYFKIELNKSQLSADFSGSIWNASVSSATHEFGHAQYLGDHDTASGENVYKTTSIMSYSRDRTTMTTPQSHDLSDLQGFRNPTFNAPVSNVVEPQADFPYYDVNQLVNGKSDLVVVASVDSVNEVKENKEEDPNASHQEAVLHIEEDIYGKAASSKIKLYQTVEKVKPGQKYLLFLSYRPTLDQYVVSDGNSQTVINEDTKSLAKQNGKPLSVKIKGIQGQYSNDELKQVLQNAKSKK